MIIKILFAFFAFVFTANSETILGLRAATEETQVKYYKDLNAKVGRQIRKDYEMSEQNLILLRQSVQLFKENGISTIICLRFPTDETDSRNADRIPLHNPNDLKNSLALVENFLDEMNGHLDYVQLQNEPLAGPGKFIDPEKMFHWGFYALKWLDTLGAHIRNYIERNNYDIGFISPAFHNVELAITDTPEKNQIPYIRKPGDTVKAGEVTDEPIQRFWYKGLMEISKKYCDIIDVHLNVENVAEIQEYILNLNQLQGIILPQRILPLTTCEWSPAKEKKEFIQSNPGVSEFLIDAFTNKVDTSLWYEFMRMLDYDENFIQESFCLLNDYGLIHACYAGLHQYGNGLEDYIFSTCALLTNRSCERIYPNEPIYSRFKNLIPCGKTSVDFVKHNKEIDLFPNPAFDKLYINSNIQGIFDSVEIFDSRGVKILSKNENKQTGEFEVQLVNLSPGIYFLKIKSGIESHYSKFIISK